uniref:Uncharacterized protein n=1 Tax=Triticum urartu TaxID=4572 RepID=A0A8R7TL57_TRIUA
MLNAGFYQCYNGTAKGGEEEKEGDKLKKELLNFPWARSRSSSPNILHRSRSKEECASLLEDDDDDGDEAADDSAPAAPCWGNSSDLNGVGLCHPGIRSDNALASLLDSPPWVCGLSRLTPNSRTRFAAAVGLLTSGVESRTMGMPTVTGGLGCTAMCSGGCGCGGGMVACGKIPAEPK